MVKFSNYKNMKILLISYYFAPQNAIAAVRTTKIAKYLIKSGYDVDVLCGESNNYDPILIKDSELINHIEIINNYDFYDRYLGNIKRLTNGNINIRGSKPSKKYKILKRFASILPNPFPAYLDIFNSLLWYHRAKNRSKYLTKKYDIVLSSYGPLGSHLVGLYAKRMNQQSLWIADYRDPVIDDSNRCLVKIINRYYQHKFLARSDVSLCVSFGLARALKRLSNRAKIYVIRNGFDQEDRQFALKKFVTSYQLKKCKLVFAYCGALYNGRRSLLPLFFALSNLINGKRVKKESVEIHYAGGDSNILLSMAKKYGLQELVINHGVVPRDCSLQLANNADIVLMASWNTEKSQGVVTGKVYELFMLRKRILCFIGGEVLNSELKKMIESANGGYVYEEASGDITGLETQILKSYETKMNGKNIMQEYNDSYINQFSYESIVKQIDDVIMDNIIM